MLDMPILSLLAELHCCPRLSSMSGVCNPINLLMLDSNDFIQLLNLIGHIYINNLIDACIHAYMHSTYIIDAYMHT